MSTFFNSSKKTFLSLLLFSFSLFGASSIALSEIPLNGYDEGFYAKYVQTLHEQGLDGIRTLISTFPNEKEDEAPPTPLRILFIAVGAASCSFVNTCGVENLALIALFSGIGIVLVSFLFFRELFTPKVAFFGASLLAISPLLLALGSRALQDTFFTLMVLSSIFFYHRLWQKGRPRDSFAFGIFLLFGFLTKEIMIFFYICFTVVGIYYYKSKTLHTSFSKIFAPLVIAPIIYFMLASFIAGGIKEFFDYYLLWSERGGNVPYLAQYQQGPWFRYLVDFMLVSPLTFFLSIVGLVVPITDKKDAAGRNIAVFYFLSGFAAFSFFSFYNLRWMLFLQVFISLLAVVGIVGIVERISNTRYKQGFAILLFLCVISVEISQFYRLFVLAKVYDPVTAPLVEADGFIRHPSISTKTL